MPFPIHSPILPPMKQDPILPPGYLNALARDCFGPACSHALTAILLQAIGSLALFTGALAAHLAWYGGKRILSRLRRHVAPPEPLPPAAPRPPLSLRRTPTPDDIEDVWSITPRTLCGRLRIGSRLADLEPTLDSRFVFKKARNGSRRIVARQPGLKGWMKKRIPSVKYSTAMHYKKLATRIRQLIGLDARIPLEWLLPDNAEAIPALSSADRQAMAAARAKLSRLLADNPKVTPLVRAVEQKLGIMRMVTIRHVQPPKPGRGRRRKPQEFHNDSLISHVVRDGLVVGGSPERERAFWEAIRKVLGEDAADAQTRRLQSDIREWLNAPLASKRNRRR